jgi:hypothetical protein
VAYILEITTKRSEIADVYKTLDIFCSGWRFEGMAGPRGLEGHNKTREDNEHFVEGIKAGRYVGYKLWTTKVRVEEIRHAVGARLCFQSIVINPV